MKSIYLIFKQNFAFISLCKFIFWFTCEFFYNNFLLLIDIGAIAANLSWPKVELMKLLIRHKAENVRSTSGVVISIVRISNNNL